MSEATGRKSFPGQAPRHMLEYQGAPRWEKTKLFPGCRGTFQRASSSLEKAIALESWHMPTRWHGCPPGTSGGSAPAEQRKQGRWELRDLPETMPLELLKPDCEASCPLPYPRSKGPTLCLKVTVTLNRKEPRNKFLCGSEGGDSGPGRGNKHLDQ